MFNCCCLLLLAVSMCSVRFELCQQVQCVREIDGFDYTADVLFNLCDGNVCDIIQMMIAMWGSVSGCRKMVCGLTHKASEQVVQCIITMSYDT